MKEITKKKIYSALSGAHIGAIGILVGTDEEMVSENDELLRKELKTIFDIIKNEPTEKEE